MRSTCCNSILDFAYNTWWKCRGCGQLSELQSRTHQQAVSGVSTLRTSVIQPQHPDVHATGAMPTRQEVQVLL